LPYRGLSKCVVAAVALAAFSACGGPAVAPVTAAPAYQYASILPDRPVTSNARDYEYIINQYGSYATIFDYPASHKQIGAVGDVGGQGCTNVLYGYGKKTFWIVAGENQITEYEAPKKPLKTLSTPSMFPSSCAMNSDGDLAVGILVGNPNGAGDVVIFKGASGAGSVISTPMRTEFFDGYDAKGNLFADGYISNGFGLVELPKGGKAFKPVRLTDSIKLPGSVQWDGKYLTVLDQQTLIMHRYAVSGTRAQLKGTVSLLGVECSQTWIATGVVYCADGLNDDGAVFRYPAGGSAIATLTGNFDSPLGVVAVEK
jgi:hypothetical protein